MAAYFAWAQGLLADWGHAPVQQSEPQRVAQQIRPEALKILPADEVRKVESAPAAPKLAECLQAGPFEEAQAAPLRASLAALAGRLLDAGAGRGAGPLDRLLGQVSERVDAVNKKKAELRYLGVSFQPGNPTLEFGLSLGTFPTEADANGAVGRPAGRSMACARRAW